MKNNKSIFHPIKLIGALVFLMAFVLNIQTSLNGDWELVNAGFAQGTGDGGSGGVTCPAAGQVGGDCHTTRTERKYTAYGWALCTYCEWSGYQSDNCDPMTDGGCETI